MNNDEFYCINCDQMLDKDQYDSEVCPACGEHPSIRVFHCQGKNCNSKDTQPREDAYGLFTGHYCDDCYENNYPYRKDAYYDPAYAGEHLDYDY